jgi:hypothetical protein
MLSMSGMIHIVLVMIVLGVICGLLWWLIGFCQIPEPFNKLARIAVAIFAVLVCISMLLSAAGMIGP